MKGKRQVVPKTKGIEKNRYQIAALRDNIITLPVRDLEKISEIQVGAPDELLEPEEPRPDNEDFPLTTSLYVSPEAVVVNDRESDKHPKPELLIEGDKVIIPDYGHFPNTPDAIKYWEERREVCRKIGGKVLKTTSSRKIPQIEIVNELISELGLNKLGLDEKKLKRKLKKIRDDFKSKISRCVNNFSVSIDGKIVNISKYFITKSPYDLEFMVRVKKIIKEIIRENKDITNPKVQKVVSDKTKKKISTDKIKQLRAEMGLRRGKGRPRKLGKL